ncbi:MAG TPA: hypothetical protein PK453_05085 [Leptospiraceae bacterium]|nr:hypothetical protein [Leptospiraceae bacterium]HMY70017.1 hypothetical protein [Leptospiraceae bacterium]HNF13022.1 hypothetical protein [Leptospiraceae bacterium]HNI97795.1 hypothetical protein [Leptospiraceae bacterium]HNM04552.1 hypothetical protein [Leptospiraceae bacterium]
MMKLLIIYLFCILAAVSEISSESADDGKSFLAADRRTDFYIQASRVNWTPAAGSQFFRMQETRNLEGALFKGSLPLTSGFHFNTGKAESVQASSIGAGMHIGSKSGTHRGHLNLQFMESSPRSFNSLNYYTSGTAFNSFSANYAELAVQSHSMNSQRRTSLGYDHDFYLLPDHPSRFLTGLGLKVGALMQYDTMSGGYTSFGSYAASSTAASLNTGNSIPVKNRIKFDDYMGLTLIGLVYRLVLTETQEIELGMNYYRGLSDSRSVSTVWRSQIYSANIPIPGDFNYRTVSDVQGNSWFAAWILRLTESRSLKLSWFSRILTYDPQRSETKEYGTFFSVKPMGPFSKVQDSINALGLEFQFKF